ncbi:MAG: hypothetical protein FWD85_07310 [Microbacteriaceae bacterium]|nr:hypothetical protein [Microbacteriaceae bacterium]
MFASPRRTAQFIAFVLTVAAIIAIVFVPSYSIETTSSDHGASYVVMSAYAVNGGGILVPLAFPFVFAVSPLLTRGRAWRPVSIVSAVLLALFTLVAILSMGVFLIPAAIVELVAVFVPSRAWAHRAA